MWKRGFSFETFYGADSFEFRAISVPADQERLLYAKLTAVNGFTADEVAERLAPYIFADNRYALLDRISSYMRYMSLLQAAGIAEYGESAADFTFELDDGTNVTYTAAALTGDEYGESERIRGSLKDRLVSPLENNDDVMLYKYFPEDDMLYIRFNGFGRSDGSDSEEWSEFFDSLYSDEAIQGGVGKIAVDFRSNSGGQIYNSFYGFIEFIDSLEADGKYLLIDSGDYSAAVIAPAMMKLGTAGSVLVGSPTCQAPNMYCFYKYDNFAAKLPVHGVGYAVSDYYSIIWPDYPYDALMTDITVYQTVEDYKNGVDTVMEEIRGRE